MRLAQARKLLAETNQPVAEIAVACGYVDIAHFSRQFHARVGGAPGGYRRRNKASAGSSTISTLCS